MKFCEKCGKELLDDAVVCMGCGCAVGTTEAPVQGSAEALSAERNENVIPAEKSSSAIVGIVLGLVGIVGAWLIALLGYILGGIALGLSISAKKKAPNNGTATAGIVIACIALVCAVINSILGIAMMM